MDKSHIEKRIEQRAEERLETEYNDLKNQLYSSKILGHLKIGGKHIRGSDVLPDFHNIKLQSESEITNITEIIEKRRQELIKEETDLILNKLENLNYLFQ